MSNIGEPIKRHEILPIHNVPQETPGERRRTPALPNKEPASTPTPTHSPDKMPTEPQR